MNFCLIANFYDVVDVKIFRCDTQLGKNHINSQAPDVPELANHGIFQLSRLGVNCYVKTMKKYPLHFHLTDFMKILSVPQDYYNYDFVFQNFFRI